MKKMVTFVSALLLVCSISGCSKDEAPAALPETQPNAIQTTAEEETSELPIELDLFVAAEVTTSKDFDDEDFPYPLSFRLNVTSTDNSLPDKAIKIRLLSAGLETITYELIADEDILQRYLEENDLVLKETSKEYSMDVSELPSLLISADLLTEENMQTIISSMENSVNTYIEWSNSITEEAIAWGVPDAGELRSANFAPAACYASLPDADTDYSFLVKDKETLHTYDGFNCYDDYGFYVIFEGEEGTCYVCKADTVFDSNQKLTDETVYHEPEVCDNFEEAVNYVTGLSSNIQQLDVLPESVQATSEEEMTEADTAAEP